MKNGQWSLLLLAASSHHCVALTVEKADQPTQTPDTYDETKPFAMGPDYYTTYDKLNTAGHGPPKEALTADGRREQPTHQIGWLAPTPQVKKPEIACAQVCPGNSYCWQGKCTYRPWAHTDDPRKSCYADPTWTGGFLDPNLDKSGPGLYRPGGRLSEYEKSVCRETASIFSEASCSAAAKYCKWSIDAPTWYRNILNGKEAVEENKWHHEQAALKDDSASNRAVNNALKYANPGNPVLGTVLSSPHRRYITDRGTR